MPSDPTDQDLERAREVAGFLGSCEFSTADPLICPVASGPPCEPCRLRARIATLLADTRERCAVILSEELEAAKERGGVTNAEWAASQFMAGFYQALKRIRGSK